jgi:hypothetical protein
MRREISRVASIFGWRLAASVNRHRIRCNSEGGRSTLEDQFQLNGRHRSDNLGTNARGQVHHRNGERLLARVVATPTVAPMHVADLRPARTGFAHGPLPILQTAMVGSVSPIAGFRSRTAITVP